MAVKKLALRPGPKPGQRYREIEKRIPTTPNWMWDKRGRG